MEFLFIGIGILTLSLIALKIALGLWMYTDAKIHSGHSPILWLIIFIFSNIIGLILYLTIGRNKNDVNNVNKFKIPVIITMIFFMISIVSVTYIASKSNVYANSPSVFHNWHRNVSSGVWTFARTNLNIQEGYWTLDIRYGNGRRNTSLLFSEINSKSLNVESTNTDGTLILHITQNETIKSIDITGVYSDYIDLSNFQTGVINLTLEFNRASNSKITLSWNN